MQVHVGDDLGIEQTDRIAGDGVAEAGIELLRDRCAADQFAAFQHQDLQSGAGQIERADQSVMTGTDQNGIVTL